MKNKWILMKIYFYKIFMKKVGLLFLLLQFMIHKEAYFYFKLE